jgi:hypothetical protein
MLKTENFETLPASPYLAVDSIPEIAAPRQSVRDSAWAMVRQRDEAIRAGSEVLVPLEIDALSTAEAVLEARDTYGSDSLEYQEKRAGLELDCLRLVAEWYRKLKPEYFPPTRQFFDAETGDFFSHGLSIRQMTENALRPIDEDPEEVVRRVNERVENETPMIIKKLGGFALETAGIRTISECTDKAIADFNEDKGIRHRGYSGYVPEIEKVMIRDIRFDAETGDRLEEQIGLPGLYINHFVIKQALGRRGVEVSHMDKTELHGTQLLVEDDLIDFVALLDEVAGKEWCTNIFMGEEVSEDFVKNYADIRQEASERQEGLKDTAGTVATFIMDLAEDGFDKRRAPAHVESFVKKLLLTMAKDNIELAPHMFDSETTVGLMEVAYYESIGDRQAAFDKFAQVEAKAPGGGYCGAGSCGLENIDLHTEKGKALAQKLKVETGDKVVRDTERTCKCGKKSIVYAYNSKKVNKYCESCHATEFKQTSSKAA